MNMDRKWWILLSVGIGTFMSALDGSVVNISLPVIRQSFESNVAQVEWIVTVYLLVLSGLLLTFGRLGDLGGHKPVYIAGFIFFVSSSALCGLARNLPVLVFFRATQALGAAMISANSPAILTKNFPASQRGQALGLQATMTYLGLTVGPSLGGWLTSQFNWRFVFYINVPVSLLALWLSLRFIPADAPAERPERFDLLGAATFLGGLTALLLGLNQGHELGWTSAPILILFVLAVALLGAFLVVESRARSPMLDLNLFRRPVFSLSVVSAIFNYICIYSILFLMPFYLIQGRGFNPAQAGLLLTAQPIVMAIIAPISGTLSDRVGARLPGMLGMAILALGVYLLSRLGPSSSSVEVGLSLAVVGFGTGTFISPNNNALMGSAPRNRQGIAAGVLATARNFGMVLGVGLAGAIFTTIVAQGQAVSEPALFSATRATFLVTCGITLLGVITTGARVDSRAANNRPPTAEAG